MIYRNFIITYSRRMYIGHSHKQEPFFCEPMVGKLSGSHWIRLPVHTIFGGSIEQCQEKINKYMEELNNV